MADSIYCADCGQTRSGLEHNTSRPGSHVFVEWVAGPTCMFEGPTTTISVVVPRPLFPHDSAERKAIPIVSGLLDYFPSALIEVAKVSKAGNDKHNPGQPLHHARGKSMDHPDSAVRHIMEFRADPNAVDPDTGLSVLAHALWRVAAMLQEHLERQGAPLAPGAKLGVVK